MLGALDRVGQAALILGAPGSGRGRLAERICQAQYCTGTGGSKPCGACGPCADVQAGRHPDVHWLGVSAKLGIDEVRDICGAAARRPLGSCSCFVLEAAERLTGPAAAALLKVLEDPPGPALFLLLAEHRDRVAPTLVSRCLQIRLPPVSVESIAAWLARRRPDAPEAARRQAALAARGLPGRALALLDPASGVSMSSWASLVEALDADSPQRITAAAAALASQGRQPAELLALCRDACAWTLGALTADGAGLSGAGPELLEAVARHVPPERLASAGWAFLEAVRAEQANVNATLNWQVLLLELRGLGAHARVNL